MSCRAGLSRAVVRPRAAADSRDPTPCEGSDTMSKIQSSCPATIRALLPLLLAIGLLLPLVGCSDDEDTGNVTQIPFPDPDETNWILSIWGTGPNDVYMVGNPGFVLHWDGTEWTRTDLTDETLTTIWGDGEGQIYICGHAGLIYRRSGDAWVAMDSGTEENLYDIGTGPYGATYAVGYDGALRKLSGDSWGGTQRRAYRNYPDEGDTLEDLAPTDTLSFSLNIETLAVVCPYAIGGDSAIVIMENAEEGFDHEWAWGEVEDQKFSLITAATRSDVIGECFLATATGKLLKLVQEGDELQFAQPRTTAGTPLYPSTYPSALTDLWLDTDEDMLYMSTVYGQIARIAQDGTGAETLYDDSTYYSAVWGSGASDIYAAGIDGRVVHWDGTEWSLIEVPLPDNSADGKARPAIDQFGRPLL